jgi:hypothetical protein
VSSKTEVKTPAPTAQEIALQQKQVELAEFQLEELKRQRTQQELFAKELEPLLKSQTEAAQKAQAQQDKMAPIQEELLNLALEDLRRGGKATPEQIELIGQATEQAIAAGSTDIERFQTDSLQRIRDELAPSLGLRPTDTPILDRAGRVGAEAVRQGGQLTAGLRSAQAQAELNFPLAQSSLLQQSALGQQNILEATRQFQDQLRGQAFNNRLNMASTLGGLGLQLAGNPAATLSSAINPMAQTRLANTTTTQGGFGLSQFAQGLGGAGGLLTGLSATGIFSSRDYKTDKAPVSEERILDAVERLPVETWRYKGDDRMHVGTYAEDFQETFGLGDGRTIDLIDALGVMTASVKALGRKVKRLEAAGFGLNDNEIESDQEEARGSGFGLRAA